MHAPEVANSKLLEATRTTMESRTKLTSELPSSNWQFERLSRPAMDTRAIESARAAEDTSRLLSPGSLRSPTSPSRRAVGPADLEDLDDVREHVATNWGNSVTIRGDIQELYRMVKQEEIERRAAVEAVQGALRVSEERIFGMLEDLCRNQVSSRAVEMERAERISACNKIIDELEAEKTARLGACSELASDFNRLRSKSEKSLQKSVNFMKEQSSMIETRVRETDFAMQQSVRYLEGNVATRQLGEKSLEEKLVTEIVAVRKMLERETTERLKVDMELDGAIKTELQALKSELKQELAERVKGDEDCLDTLKRRLEQELAERMKADERCLDALRQGLDKARTEREGIKLLTETVSNASSQDYTLLLEKRIGQSEALTRMQLEDEAKARVAGDAELGSKMKSELQRMAADLEREAAVRIAADELVRKELERETSERLKVDGELGSAQGAIQSETQSLRNLLKQELAERVKGDENCLDALKRAREQELGERVKADKMCLDAVKQGLDEARTEREDIKRLIETRAKTLSQDYTLLLEERVSQTESVTRNLLEDEGKARAAADEELGSKMQSELVRMAADLEREAAARIEGDKDTAKKQIVDDLQKQMDQETKARIAGDEQMGKFFTEGLEKAGIERSEILNMVDKGLEKARLERSEILNTVEKGLEKARLERSEIFNTVDKGLEKAGLERSEILTTVDKGLEKARLERSEILNTVDKGLETARLERSEILETVDKGLEKARMERSDIFDMVDKGLQKARIERSDIEAKVTEGLEKAGIERSDILNMVDKGLEKARLERSEILDQVDKGLQKAGLERSEILETVDKGLEKARLERSEIFKGLEKARLERSEILNTMEKGLEKARLERSDIFDMVDKGLEKARIERSEILHMAESTEAKVAETAKVVEKSFREATADLQQQLEKEVKVRMASDEQMGKLLTDGLQGKLEQSCRGVRAETDEALNKAVASLKAELAALGDKNDTLDRVTREIRGEVEENKQCADQEWLLMQKDVQNHKAQYEEYKGLREAAHSSLQSEMEKIRTWCGSWRSEITQLENEQDLLLQRLQGNCDILRREHEEFTSVVWKDELRRVWEAMDSHTHPTVVKDFQERESPTQTVIRTIVREAPPIIAAGTSAAAPVTTRGMVVSNSARLLASINNPFGMTAAPRMASPSQSPDTARYSRSSLTMAPPPSVIQPELASSVMRRSPPSLHRTQSFLDTSSSAVSVSVSGGVGSRDGSPNLATQRGLIASMGRPVHDIRSQGSSTVTERTEESTIQPGKVHHHLEAMVAKAVFKHTSDLDPETRRDSRV